ncbi:MAG TPA: protein translocase subunit SecF [Candidatus Acidoferrum sp.]|nr:protein translocase subunit SecF [Candidatus Acidoferrum sp.]
MFALIGIPKIDFIGKRKYAFIFSTILCITGIIAFIMIGVGKAPMGIDFAGGVMLQGHFEQTMSIEEVRAAVTQLYPDAVVTEVKDFSHPNAFIIKTKRPSNEAEGMERVKELTGLLQTKYVGNNFTIDSEHVIGPAVGESLKKSAWWAIVVSMIGILIYIAFRFDFRAGVAATIATFHDVLAVTGIFFVLGREFDLLVVTALLTLAGYSLTDTVVVYDRIRENLKKYRGKADFVPAVNRSINETLSRTINTSMTVMVVVVILFLFGGEVLRSFSLALIMGVIVGTYSSIFVASPIMVEWEARSPKRYK